MSISGYFGKSPNEFRADRKDRGPQKESPKRYVSIDDYDPVLRSHCRLTKPVPAPPNAAAQDPPQDYWTRALDAYFKAAHPKTELLTNQAEPRIPPPGTVLASG